MPPKEQLCVKSQNHILTNLKLWYQTESAQISIKNLVCNQPPQSIFKHLFVFIWGSPLVHQIQNLPRVRSRHSQNGLSSNKHGLQYGKSNRIYTTVFVVVLRVGSLLCLLRQKRECVHNTPPTRRHLCGTNRHHHLFVCKSKTIICLQKQCCLQKHRCWFKLFV